jgi:hypothetical protein
MCSLTQGKKRTALISLRNPRLSQANASTQSNSGSFPQWAEGEMFLSCGLTHLTIFLLSPYGWFKDAA